MRFRHTFYSVFPICLLIVYLLPTNPATATQDSSLAFDIPGTGGGNVSVSRSTIESLAVIGFLSNECPLAKLYALRLNELNSEFSSRGVRFVGVNSNQQDSMPELVEFKASLGISLELCKDYENKIADQFGASRTAEVFVLDNNLNVRYQGRIDDQYSPGVAKSAANKFYLKDAIEQLLAGNQVRVSSTKPVGCLIGRVKNSIESPTVTFANQVSRLINKHCLECHRSGEIGPFALQDYDEVKGWAEMIVEVVDNNRMPPWHATGEHNQFLNARRLNESEKQVFRDWLQQGAAFGDSRQLPSPPKFTVGWRLPKEPDMVVAMRDKPFLVPANGTVEYQYFVVDPGFEHDTWITAAEVIPGNRSVVHHSIVFIRPPDGAPFKGIGWLAAYVPGQGKPLFRNSHAHFIPAGSKLVFQQHYTPIGIATSDTTKIGIVFGDVSDITHEIYTLAGLDQSFEIPAMEQDHPVNAELTSFPRNGELISIAPHMHFRGKSFQLFAEIDGKRKQIIDVPTYDFNWQHNYQFSQPVDLSSIELFECHFKFDNSANNPFNPDHEKIVTWGDQTWEEMAVAFFEVAEPLDAAKPRETVSRNVETTGSPDSRVDEFVDQYFHKFDSNNDQLLVKSELPRAVRQFKFFEYDIDGDKQITRNELSYAVRERFED